MACTRGNHIIVPFKAIERLRRDMVSIDGEIPCIGTNSTLRDDGAIGRGQWYVRGNSIMGGENVYQIPVDDSVTTECNCAAVKRRITVCGSKDIGPVWHEGVGVGKWRS